MGHRYQKITAIFNAGMLGILGIQLLGGTRGLEPATSGEASHVPPGHGGIEAPKSRGLTKIVV